MLLHTFHAYETAEPAGCQAVAIADAGLVNRNLITFAQIQSAWYLLHPDLTTGQRDYPEIVAFFEFGNGALQLLPPVLAGTYIGTGIGTCIGIDSFTFAKIAQTFQ